MKPRKRYSLSELLYLSTLFNRPKQMDEERKSHKETVQLNLNADSTPQNSLAQAVEGSSMVNNTSSSESEADDYTHPSDTQVHVSESRY
jgi:hypothetical protein